VEHELGSGPFYLFIGADADYSTAWYEALYVSDGDGASRLSPRAATDDAPSSTFELGSRVGLSSERT
jgi:hypothetical protein